MSFVDYIIGYPLLFDALVVTSFVVFFQVHMCIEEHVGEPALQVVIALSLFLNVVCCTVECS